MKEYLSQKGVAFIERDVAKDDQAMQELAAIGYLTTPVIKVGDEIVVGFDRQKLEALLG